MNLFNHLIILGLTICALGIHALILKNKFNDSSFRSFSEPYKYRLAKLPLNAIVGILVLGAMLVVGPIINLNNNNLPQDLQTRKDANNAKYFELLEKEKSAFSTLDYEQLVKGYNSFKNETISYTAECNRRGISKNNDEIVKEADEKISKYQKLVNSANTNIDNSKQESDLFSCEICGRKFTGKGYCEGDDGIWRQCEEPYQGQICSPECGRRATGQFNKAASDLINSSNQNQMNNNNSDDYYERKREQMRRQGYTEGEINEMRDPNNGDPEIKESAKKVFDAIREQARENH